MKFVGEVRKPIPMFAEWAETDHEQLAMLTEEERAAMKNANDFFALSVASAGDINADQVPDILIGAFGVATILATIKANSPIVRTTERRVQSIFHAWLKDYFTGEEVEEVARSAKCAFFGHGRML